MSSNVEKIYPLAETHNFDEHADLYEKNLDTFVQEFSLAEKSA